MPIFIAPQTAAELPVFYLVWVLAYLIINVVWDIFSGRTPEFHISNMGQKTPTAANAASFASSLLLIIGLVDKDTMKVAGDTLIPILLSGLSGMFFAIQDICPYKPEKVVPVVRHNRRATDVQP